jgi:subtilase family serine protease
MEKRSLSEPTLNSSRSRTAALCITAIALMVGAALPAAAASGKYIRNNTPNYVATAKNLGAENPAKVIDVSIWLAVHNRAQLDALAAQLYDPTSPNYRHFLKPSQIAASFAPSAEEAGKVQSFFTSHNLKIVAVGPSNFYVRARGTVGDVETAFQVQLNNYKVGGKVVRANASDPFVEGDAAAVVASVSGLDTGEFEHPLIQRGSNVVLPKAAGTKPSAAASQPDFFTSTCFGTETETFSNGQNGSFPIATYSGNDLLLQSLTSYGCAYTPPSIATAYNLTGLYAEGYDGSGQTIAIIDWCGTPTIQNDANAFSTQFNLPQLTASNFQITYTPTVSTCQAEDNPEINLDVEWSHAIAPGANINLVVPPSASFQDVNEAEYNIVNYGLGTVISGSYGSVESFTPASELANENMISEIAAISGISTNFASGDSGDFTADGIPATVLAPADSPYATAIGGISLALKSTGAIAWQAGWGNNEILLAEEGAIADPPESFGFIGGSGGGPSTCATQDSSGDCLAGFPKPSYQKGVPGRFRQLPDVSWLADPYTGAAIAISIPFQEPSLVWQVYGGTSLATPMFSGLWAIANQEAGAPLGQAAPYMYKLPAGTVYDIVPVTSKTNVTGSIQESAGVTTTYTAAQLLGAGAPKDFVSAIWDYPAIEYTPLIISFGTDCDASATFGTPCNSSSALTTKKGWDNVTGVGVPNGKAFADSFAPKSR